MESIVVENKKRHIEFDIAKTICIIGMVMVYMFEEFHPVMESGGFFDVLVNILQMLIGAPCFMFCMGAGIVFSSHSDYRSLIKRGINIFVLSYVLNLLIDPIFLTIIELLRNVPFSIFERELFHELFFVDILAFAGLALILMGILNKYNFDEKEICIVAIILSIIGSFVRNINIEPHFNYFIGLFVGTTDPLYEYSPTYFPMFNWFIFVAFGYLFGKVLLKLGNKNKMYRTISPIFLVIVGCYLIYAIPNNIGMINPDLSNFYQLTILDAFISILPVIGVLGAYHFLSFILPKFLLGFFSSLSRNINRIYCIHWIIIGNMTEVLYDAFEIYSFLSIFV